MNKNQTHLSPGDDAFLVGVTLAYLLMLVVGLTLLYQSEKAVEPLALVFGLHYLAFAVCQTERTGKSMPAQMLHYLLLAGVATTFFFLNGTNPFLLSGLLIISIHIIEVALRIRPVQYFDTTAALLAVLVVENVFRSQPKRNLSALTAQHKQSGYGVFGEHSWIFCLIALVLPGACLAFGSGLLIGAGSIIFFIILSLLMAARYYAPLAMQPLKARRRKR